MTTIDALVRAGRRGILPARPLGLNPFAERDVLQECQLVAVRSDAIRGRVDLLFDLRVALQLDEGNTGVLVAHGVDSLTVELAGGRDERTAWVVGNSGPVGSGGWRLALGLSADLRGMVEFAARDAVFFVGDVPGLPEAPPDYVDDTDEKIDLETPSFDSDFVPIAVARYRPAGAPGLTVVAPTE